MSIPQWLSVVTLIGMMSLFLWGRFRYDVTAVIALLAAVLIGIVKPADAFKDVFDDIVIIERFRAALPIVAVHYRICVPEV